MKGVTLICAYHRREHEHAHCTHACWIPWFRLCGLGLTVQAFWFRSYGLGFLVYALGNTNVFVHVVQTPVGSHGKRTPLRIKALWFRLYGLGFMVQALWFRQTPVGSHGKRTLLRIKGKRPKIHACTSQGLGLWFRLYGLGFMVQVLWFRLYSLGIRETPQDPCLRITGFRLMVWDSWFRLYGLGCMVQAVWYRIPW